MGIANLVSNSVEKETKVMWCKNCNLETNEAICPVCGLETSEDLPVEIYWCNDCRIPVIHVSTAADKGICPVCHGKTRYLTADLRPVFPEERLLIALLLDKAPDALMGKFLTGKRTETIEAWTKAYWEDMQYRRASLKAEELVLLPTEEEKERLEQSVERFSIPDYLSAYQIEEGYRVDRRYQSFVSTWEYELPVLKNALKDRSFH